MLRCPDCKKKGVFLRLKKNGEDNYKCRYCDFYCFTSDSDTVFVEERRRLVFENRIEEISQDTLEKWYRTLLKTETKLGDCKSVQAIQSVVDDIGELLGYEK